jgi:putative membrane protein
MPPGSESSGSRPYSPPPTFTPPTYTPPAGAVPTYPGYPPPPPPPPGSPPPARYPPPPGPPGSPERPTPSQLPAGFHRLHPLTPVVYGARLIGVLAVIAIANLSERTSAPQQNSSDPGVTFAIYAAIAVLVVVGGFVSWLVTRYRVEQGELRVDSGLLRRQSKRLRLDRLQSVDVLRPLVARVFGLAELRLTAGGSEHTSVRLRYLPSDLAQELRAELLGRAAGLGPGVAEAPERPLVVVSPGALIGSTLLDLASGRGLLLLIGPVVAAILAANGSKTAAISVGVATFVPFLVVVVGDVWRRLNTQWQFTVAESPDGLRLRAGLLSTRAQTVPPGRIQALRVRQPLLWRIFGLAAVHMNVAGVVGRSQSSNRILLPVAPLAVARGLVEYVLGGVQIDNVIVTRPPRRAALCSPLWWRAMAAGSDERIFVSRHGLLAPTIDVVPNARTQSVRLRAGPWQRLWGLATLHLDSTRGPVRIRAAHRDAAEGRLMLDTQAEKARVARKAAAPERWMKTAPGT